MSEKIILKNDDLTIKYQKINLKNISNDGSIKEEQVRFIFYHKPDTIENMNKRVINFLSWYYDEYFHKINNKSIEFDFCTVNSNGRFGHTRWLPLDQTLSKEEWDKKISEIDVNNTFALYEEEEKKFDEETKRDKFWLNFRIRPNIGYGSGKGSGFCFFNSFFKALINANVINITKHKIIKDSSYVYKYNESLQTVYNGVIDRIHKLNDLNKSYGRFKEVIYLDEKGGIDFNDISKLEKFFKCNIVVNHNNQYPDKHPSSKKYNITVYLTYNNGHYDLDKDYKPVFDFFDDKALYIPKKLDILVNDGTKYYDGKKIYNIEELNDEEKKILYKMKHRVYYKKLKKYYETDDIKEFHDMYKKDCEELEKYKVKILNSFSLQKAIFQMLKLDIRYLNIEVEKVTDIAEYEILSKGTKGGYNYIYKLDEIFRDVYSYDVKSSYPSILSHPDFQIPIKKGEYKHVYPEIFKKYTELKKDKNGFYKIDLQYGLYKCKISKIKKSDKFDDFRINDYKIYTHFDILLAKILGYDVELLNENIYPYVRCDNNKPYNCFTYKKDMLIDSNIIFRKIVKKLYDIKQVCKGNKVIKVLTSGIWGNLCDDKTYCTKTVKKENGEFTIEMEEGDYLDYLIPNIEDEDNAIDCKYKKSEKITRTSLFRMKPFLLSFQRYIMYIECIKKIEDAGGKILKIKIDGVYTDKKIDEFEKVNKIKINEHIDDIKPPIDGDIVRDNHFDIILFKDKTYYLTTEQDIKEYLISKKNKKPKKYKKK